MRVLCQLPKRTQNFRKEVITMKVGSGKIGREWAQEVRAQGREKEKPLSATHNARPPTAMLGNKGTQIEKMSSLESSLSAVALTWG